MVKPNIMLFHSISTTCVYKKVNGNIFLAMKYFLTLIIITIIFQNGYSQGVSFQLYRIKCDNIERLDSGNYYLKNLATGFETNFQNVNGIVNLPDTGRYQIYIYYEPDTDLEPIHIKETGLFQYKYYEPKILVRQYGMYGHGPAVYEECGVPINGFKEDFYPNGKTRIRGNFENGRPTDSLVTFYKNGVTERRLTFLSKEVVIEEYDSLNNRISVSRNSNKSYFLTDYITTDFYPNGELKKVESKNNKLLLIKAFYPNGAIEINQTKNNRTEYYGSGRIRTSYTWEKKRKRVIYDECKNDFIITMISYDTLGQISEKIVFKEWCPIIPQPNLDITKSDWILNWVIYKQGKETLVTKDIYTKKYFNQSEN